MSKKNKSKSNGNKIQEPVVVSTEDINETEEIIISDNKTNEDVEKETIVDSEKNEELITPILTKNPELTVEKSVKLDEEEDELIEKEDKKEIEEISLVKNIPLESNSNDELRINKGGKIIIKDSKEKDNKTQNRTGKFKLIILKNGSPLQVINVRKKLDSLKFNYDFDENTNTFTSHEFGRKEEAVAVKKYLLTKGLRPIIENL